MKKTCSRFFLIVILALAMLVQVGLISIVYAEETENYFTNGDCESAVADSLFKDYAAGKVNVSADAYGGKQAYLFSGGGNDGVQGEKLTDAVREGAAAGRFFEFSYFVKYNAAPGALATYRNNMIIQDYVTGFSVVNLGDDPEKDYFYVEKDKGYIQRKFLVAFYQPQGETLQIYVDGRPVQETSLVKVETFSITMGVPNTSDKVLVDNIVFAPGAVYKDAVFTLTDQGVPLKNAEITVYDQEGKKAEGLKIEGNEGVYTVKDLCFETVLDQYTFKVEGYDDFTGVIGYNDPSSVYTVTAYQANIIVKDEQGAAVSDAVIELSGTNGAEKAINNGDGSYSFNKLYTMGEIKVVKNGYIPQYAEIDFEHNEKEITLQKTVQGNALKYNLVENGNFESAELYWSKPAEITDRYQMDGNHSMLLQANSVNSTVNRLNLYSLNLTEGITYRIELWARRFEGNGQLAISPLFTGKNGAGQWVYVPDSKQSSDKYITISDTEWQRVSMDLYVLYDSEQKTVEYSIDGGDVVTVTDIESINAFDLRIYVNQSATIAVDNVLMMPYYDAEISVLQKDGTAAEQQNTKIVIKNLYGEEIDPSAITYNTETKKYEVKNLYGENRVFVTESGESLPEKVLSLYFPSIEAKHVFSVKVFLKDESGVAVTGASVIADNGKIFIDMGDGSYVLQNVEDSVRVKITKFGYEFSDGQVLQFNNKEITVTGKALPAEDGEEEQDKENPKEESGCNASQGGGALCVGAGVLLLAAGVMFFKKINRREKKG